MTHKTLSVLGAEHGVLLSIARLLEAEALRAGRNEPPNLELVEAIVEYLRDYPCQFHHPKEERYLFPALRRHGDEVAAAIDRLESDHAAEDGLIKALDASIAGLAATGPAEASKARQTFADAARVYASFLEGHVRAEEDRVFPLAARVLTETEWTELDGAFLAHADPMLQGEDEHFRQLRLHIAALGAPPFGM